MTRNLKIQKIYDALRKKARSNRLDKKISQNEMARESGLPAQTFTQFERGTSNNAAALIVYAYMGIIDIPGITPPKNME